MNNGKNINEKIQEIIEWSNKYPRAQVHYLNCPQSIVRQYAPTEKEQETFKREYERIQEYYLYVRSRKSRRKTERRTNRSL